MLVHCILRYNITDLVEVVVWSARTQCDCVKVLAMTCTVYVAVSVCSKFVFIFIRAKNENQRQNPGFSTLAIRAFRPTFMMKILGNLDKMVCLRF